MEVEQSQQALSEEQAQTLWNELAAEKEPTPPTATTPPADAVPAAEIAPESVVPSTSQAPAPADPAPTPAPDPLQEVMARLEKMESRTRNVEGHVGGLKDALQRTNELLAAGKAAAKSTDGPSEKQVADAFKSPEAWENLKQDFPEWGTATEALLDARLAALQPAAASIDPAVIERMVNERIEALSAQQRSVAIETHLEGTFPGWKNEVKTAQFDTWLKSQPSDVQQLADSPHVGDATRLLRLYDNAKQADPSSRIEAERKAKLAAAAATPKNVRAPARKSIDDMSAEELWAYEAELREKQKAQRGY